MEEEPKKSADRQDGFDERLLRRLLSRAMRPGVVNMAQGEAIIARHRSMATAMPLAERLNRVWFDFDDGKSEAAPIVYVQSGSYAPDIGAPAGGRGKAENKKGESANLAQRVSNVEPRSVPSSPGRGSGEGSHNMVVQRKPVQGASLSPMLPQSAFGGDRSVATPMPGQTLPLVAPIRAPEHRDRLVDHAMSHDGPVNVNGVEMTNDPLLPSHSPIGEGTADVDLAPDPMALPMNRALTGPQTTEDTPGALPLLRIQPRAGATALPIVRESSVTETRWTAVHGQGALPLAEKARASQVMTEHSAGALPSQSIAARGAAAGRARPTPPANRNRAADGATSAEIDRQPAPNIDIDQIVDKVERRFARRFAVEAERRGKRRWL